MTYRILSLDGGGIRGIISAVILAEVERILNQPLNQYFDLIAGTSTGSILASAIATGRKSQEIIRLYQEKGARIFPYQGGWGLAQWGWKGRLIDVLFDASSDIHDYITRQILSSQDLDNPNFQRYIRLQPDIMNFEIDNASPENIANLTMFAQDYIAENQQRLKYFLTL
ncbi:patatin-like phospholipase family protein [Coleofasciculus sp.]|uniref:patatin-like phospholipase family protein n=1 Tax=Coleofasciculus sp. TaxID=3100458 RepID=UPI003A1212B7